MNKMKMTLRNDVDTLIRVVATPYLREDGEELVDVMAYERVDDLEDMTTAEVVEQYGEDDNLVVVLDITVLDDDGTVIEDFVEITSDCYFNGVDVEIAAWRALEEWRMGI